MRDKHWQEQNKNAGKMQIQINNWHKQRENKQSGRVGQGEIGGKERNRVNVEKKDLTTHFEN